MIIVSQDKTKIFNFDNLIQIYITQDEEKTATFIRYETVDSLYDDLGQYKTEERAKEVLQDIIAVYQMSKIYECSETKIQASTALESLKIKQQPFKYEMPKE